MLSPMNPSFLQSPAWGQFQTQVGAKVIAIGETQVLAYSSPLGVFWYAPHVTEYEKIVEAARVAGVLFVRVEPLVPMELPAGAIKVKNRQPQSTLVLDLTKSSDELLAAMHQKTRYNIRLSEKKNLRVDFGKNPAVFVELMKETSQRDKFGAHAPEYYEKMLDVVGVEQGTVYLGNVPVASAIFIGYDKIYTYLHGASSNEHRDLMAPHLLQWSAIMRAKTNGFIQYDFWGIAPEGMENHPLAGVTRFKLGFGGERKNFGQAFEVPLKPVKYQLFTWLKKIRL